MATTMYCMRCKKNQPYTEYVDGVNKRGVNIMKATCPGCKKDMFRIASKKKAV